MFKVKFIDATNHNRVLVNEIHLDFDPRLSPVIRLKQRDRDVKSTLYQVVAGQGVAEVITDEPAMSGIEVYLKEIGR